MSAFPSYIYNPFGYGMFGWALPPVPQRVADVPAPDAPTGQAKTGDQMLGLFGVGGADANWLSGFADAPPGNYRVWRLMARQPTLALARALVIGPILSGSRCVEVRQPAGKPKKRKTGPIVGDGVISDPLDKRAEFVNDTLSPLLYELIRDMLRALVLGHKPFEVVWDVKGGMDVIKRFKSLRNEVTQIILQEGTGDFVGLKNGQSDPIYGADAFNFANDPEDDYPYGSTRMENCREQWWFGLQQWRKLGELAQKAVGISMTIAGPTGTGKKDSNGNTIDGPNAAQRVAIEVAKQRPVWMPRNLIPLDPERAGDVEYLKAWAAANEAAAFKLEQFDWGNTAPASDSILGQLAKLDVELMRGWSRPEREAMEGQHGTKAEAGTHGQVGVTDSDLCHGDCCRAISRGPINDLLERNFGIDARDSVYLEPAPIQDAAKQMLADFLKQAQSNPQNSQDMYKKLDKAKAFADLDYPIREDVDANEDPEPIVPPLAPGTPKDANADGSANGNGRMNGNGKAVKLSREDGDGWSWMDWMDGKGMPVVEGETIGGRFSREDDAPAMPDIVVNMPAQAVAGKVTKRITFDKDGDGKILGGTVTEETEG